MARTSSTHLVLTLSMLLVLLAPSPLPFPSLQARAGTITMVDAAAVPLAVGRLLNKDHELVYAAQAKEAARTKMKDHKPFLACPAGLIPCLDATASSASLSNNARLSSHSSGESGSASDDIFECVDPQRSLQSCGGCSFVRDEDGQIVRAPQEQGSDCTALPGVKGVECVRGRCEITTCKRGFRKTSLGCV